MRSAMAPACSKANWASASQLDPGARRMRTRIVAMMNTARNGRYLLDPEKDRRDNEHCTGPPSSWFGATRDKTAQGSCRVTRQETISLFFHISLLTESAKPVLSKCRLCD